MVPNLQSGGRGTAKGYSNRGVKAQQGQADEPSLRRRWIGSGSGYQEAGGPAGRGKCGGRAQGLWKVVKFQLHDFHALPEYLRDNEFIHRHYRVHWPLKESALSIFSIHNETLNIWTHLAGFWMFSWLTLYTLMKLPEIKDQLPSMMAYLHTWSSELMPLVYKILPTVVSTCLNPDAPNRPELCVLRTLPSRRTPRWPFFVFLGGAMFCLLASAMCHLFFCHSPWTSYFLLQIDYAGIVGLIVSSFYPPVYYGFMCNNTLRDIYLVAITVIGCLTIMVTMLPVFQTVKYHKFRASMFFGMGVSGVVPCIHKLFLHSTEPGAIKTLTLEVLMGMLYASGAVVYATRIPERWAPGKFDIAGNSHQLFHMLVVAGAYVHYQAGLMYLRWRDANGCDFET